MTQAFHSLKVCVGWQFCPVDMGTGLLSFLNGGDLGCSQEQWGFGEWSKKRFLMHTIVFCWFFFYYFL